MEEFPTIHTNFWDAVLAVPITLILTQLIKVIFHLRKIYLPTIATIIGLIISIFFSHRHDLWAGVFMGFFYGSSAIGVYASLKTTFNHFKNKNKHYT